VSYVSVILTHSLAQIFGYPDAVMQIANSLDPNIDPVFPGFMFNATSREAAETRKGIVSNEFSFWTGKNHNDRMRQLVKWKGMDHVLACSKTPCPPNNWTDAWATHDAGAIHGTDGSAVRICLLHPLFSSLVMIDGLTDTPSHSLVLVSLRMTS
jgi:hypothetical protein